MAVRPGSGLLELSREAEKDRLLAEASQKVRPHGKTLFVPKEGARHGEPAGAVRDRRERCKPSVRIPRELKDWAQGPGTLGKRSLSETVYRALEMARAQRGKRRRRPRGPKTRERPGGEDRNSGRRWGMASGASQRDGLFRVGHTRLCPTSAQGRIRGRETCLDYPRTRTHIMINDNQLDSV